MQGGIVSYPEPSLNTSTLGLGTRLTLYNSISSIQVVRGAFLKQCHLSILVASAIATEPKGVRTLERGLSRDHIHV